MPDPKILTEGAWKTIAQKCKIKDNGLQKALASYEDLDENAHDDLLDGIASIGQLAAALKKSKDISAAPPVAKYLTDMLSAVEVEKRDIVKAKAAAQKTEAMTQKKTEKAEAAGDEDEDDEEDGEYGAMLLAAFQKLKGAKDASYEFIVCDAKPHCCVMIAKRITPKHKEALTKVSGGSKRFLPVGTCQVQDGKFTFSTEKPVAGLARKLQASIKNFTGKKFPIVVGTETAEDDDEPQLNATNPDARPSSADAPAGAPSKGAGAPAAQAAAGGAFSITGSVGRGGKNNAPDVQAVQTALNKRSSAGLKVDGKCGPKTIGAIENFQKTLGQFKPDGLIEVGRGTARALAGSGKIGPAPAPPQPVDPPKLGKPVLAKAPDVWHSTRKVLDTNIDELKKAILGHYANEHPDLVKAIENAMGKLDAVLDKLDTKLADSLAKAQAAKDDAARKAELKTSKVILADYIKYVKSEPLIAEIDSNPFGVATNLKKVLTDSLTHMAQAIG